MGYSVSCTFPPLQGHRMILDSSKNQLSDASGSSSGSVYLILVLKANASVFCFAFKYGSTSIMEFHYDGSIVSLDEGGFPPPESEVEDSHGARGSGRGKRCARDLHPSYAPYAPKYAGLRSHPGPVDITYEAHLGSRYGDGYSRKYQGFPMHRSEYALVSGSQGSRDVLLFPWPLCCETLKQVVPFTPTVFATVDSYGVDIVDTATPLPMPRNQPREAPTPGPGADSDSSAMRKIQETVLQRR
ncbi:hypothetical protein B0H12DRAFT_1140736 [Mycena haematopus]|nr:hypothetical protein B0H12DRAFT_1140736 [Mycena haematopus]